MKKYIWHHAILWSSIIIFSIIQISSGYIKNTTDFIIEIMILSSCFSLLVEINRLKLGWMMGLGWALYGTSLLFDILDEYSISETLEDQFDIADDILKLGVVFIGIAFYNAIKAKKWLINSLQLEVEYRRDLETQLNKMICLDELTQIGNRRAFFQFYNQLVSQYERPLLIFIDLDNFKQLNDTQGHQEGDNLLIVFARCLTQQCSQHGKPYRFGGDEFVILYDGIDADNLMTSIKQNMRDTFAKTKVSISYGVVEINEAEDADAQILKADDLMYANKQQRKSLRKQTRSLPE